MRILLVTQWFDPEPTFKGLVFAKALRDAGHDVEVITGFPNYGTGKVYPTFRITWLQREVVDGIRVNRVALYPSHSASAIGRIANYGSFAITSCLYGIFAARRSDVIYAYHAPLTVPLAAAVISWFRRAPFVIDINDLWPDSLAATGMVRNPRVLAAVGAMCSWVYRRAARVVVCTPGFRSRLVARGVPVDKIDIIYNWCSESALRVPSETARVPQMQDRFNVVFAGTMGKAQALHSVLSAAKRVEQLAPRVQFVFVGGGVELGNLKSIAQALGVGNVVFIPAVPMHEVGGLLAAADLLLVHLKDDPLFRITVPAKTQAYLAVGKPIVMAVAGDAADLIRRADAGLCVEPEDDVALANAVVHAAGLPADELAAMGRRGAAFYDRELSLRTGTEKFVAVFQDALARTGPAR